MTARRLAAALVAAYVASSCATAHAEGSGQPDTWTSFPNSKLVPPIVLGARAGETSTRASGGTEGLSAMLYMSGYAPLLRLAVTMRAGRSYGADGKLAADLAVGPSVQVFGGGFVFARFGVRGQLEGNELFTVNEIEPLQAQIGFEYLVIGSLPMLFEVAGRGALATGAYVSVGDFSRNFKPAPAWGGHLAASIGPFRMEGVFTQIAPTGSSGAALDVVDIVGCLRAGRVALCGDHSQTFTGLFGPGSYYRENIATTGFTLGAAL